jgi:archaemetzincin
LRPTKLRAARLFSEVDHERHVLVCEIDAESLSPNAVIVPLPAAGAGAAAKIDPGEFELGDNGMNGPARAARVCLCSWLLRAALLILALTVCTSAVGAPPQKIYILLVGKMPEIDLATISRALTNFFPIQIERLRGIALPAEAYYAPRARYRADKLLDHVEALPLPKDGRTILAVTAAPISITKGKIHDWGIIGYVAIGGTICAYSTYYVKRYARGPAHAQERIAKIAVHEFAHNLGLKHCPTRGCLMEDAQGTPNLFDRVYDFCPKCRVELAKAGWPVPKGLEIPWPRPEKDAGPTDEYLKRLRKRWE